jgi:hypothetical protein
MNETSVSTAAVPSLAEFYDVLKRIPVQTPDGRTASFHELLRYRPDSSVDSATYAARLSGGLSFLQALGALDAKPSDAGPDDLRLFYVSERAFDFVVSMALCSRCGIVAIDTWSIQYRSDDPPWGLPLVKRMEQRRLKAATNQGQTEVVREEEVVAVLIKSRARRRGRHVDVYLCQYDTSSGCYNFIGGKRRYPLDDYREIAKHKLHDELGLSTSDFFDVQELSMDKTLETRKLSNETGVYTKYTFYFYRATHITGYAQRNRLNRWFTTEELLAGQGVRKERIMTHPEVIDALRNNLNKALYRNGLADIDLSLPSASDLQASPRRNILEWLLDNREIIAIVAAILTIVTGILKLLGLI